MSLRTSPSREPSLPRSSSRGADGFSPSPAPSSPSAYAPSHPEGLSPQRTSPSPSPSDPPPRGEKSPDVTITEPVLGPEPGRGAPRSATSVKRSEGGSVKSAKQLFVATTAVGGTGKSSFSGVGGGIWPDIGSMSLSSNMKHRRPTMEEASPSVSPPPKQGILSLSRELSSQISWPRGGHRQHQHQSQHQQATPAVDEGSVVMPWPKVVDKDYECISSCGSGSYGEVYKAVRRSDGEVVAVKVMECDKWAAEEANMLRGLDHECICKLYDFKLSEEEGASCLVMQYAAGGDLLERIVNTGPLTEKATASIAERLLRALEYMHSKGVIHRDLKPENVLYLTPDCDKPILADFGVGKRLSVGALHEDRDQAGATMTTHSRHIGTVGYCAPEVNSDAGHSFKADVWSFGAMIYVLLCGYHPFDMGSDPEEVIQGRAASGEILPMDGQTWANVSEAATDFVKKCLVVDVDERASIEDCLRHPWITGAEFGGEVVELNEAFTRLQFYHSSRRDARALTAHEAASRQKRKRESSVVSDEERGGSMTPTPSVRPKKVSILETTVESATADGVCAGEREEDALNSEASVHKARAGGGKRERKMSGGSNCKGDGAGAGGRLRQAGQEGVRRGGAGAIGEVRIDRGGLAGVAEERDKGKGKMGVREGAAGGGGGGAGGGGEGGGGGGEGGARGSKTSHSTETSSRTTAVEGGMFELDFGEMRVNESLDADSFPPKSPTNDASPDSSISFLERPHGPGDAAPGHSSPPYAPLRPVSPHFASSPPDSLLHTLHLDSSDVMTPRNDNDKDDNNTTASARLRQRPKSAEQPKRASLLSEAGNSAAMRESPALSSFSFEPSSSVLSMSSSGEWSAGMVASRLLAGAGAGAGGGGEDTQKRKRESSADIEGGKESVHIGSGGKRSLAPKAVIKSTTTGSGTATTPPNPLSPTSAAAAIIDAADLHGIAKQLEMTGEGGEGDAPHLEHLALDP